VESMCAPRAMRNEIYLPPPFVPVSAVVPTTKRSLDAEASTLNSGSRGDVRFLPQRILAAVKPRRSNLGGLTDLPATRSRNQ